jgi:hypothetical protein
LKSHWRIFINMTRHGFIFFLFCFISIGPAAAQSSSAQEHALQLFTDGNYTEALVKFKKLLTLFPNDPKYLYYTGVCMVETNTNIETAIKHLTQSANSLVPRDVYFYLGKAFHYTYQFQNALSNYEKFKGFGDKKSVDKLQTDMWIAMAKNGLNLRSEASLTVYRKDTIDADKVYEFYNRYLNNGSFHESPEHWLNLWVSSKERPYSYIPLLSPVGLSIFTSGNNSFKRNKDIYTVKKTSETQWSKPEKLPNSVNSAFDEDFVYFNESEATLYFASKGHNSIGGYDIFKTVYNPDYKTWSTPINLGYPINSPFDDYLFVPDDAQSDARFVSNRETSGKKAIVYEIEFQKEYSSSPIGKDFVFRNSLSPVASTITEKKPTEKPESKKDQAIIAAPPAKTNKTESQVVATNSKNNYPKALLDQKDYNRTIDQAMRYQLRSDSINRIIEDKRDLLNSNNANETAKSKLRSEIWALDKQAKSIQIKADSLYTKARQYESKNAGKKDQPEITDEMARSTFGSEKPKFNKDSKASNQQNSDKQKKTIVYDFKVMAHSPYKSTDEIPLDRPLPKGVIYRIQMGAFSKPIEPERFKGIVPISGETLKNGEIKKYYAGLFSRMSDAEKALNKVREYGFKDAYIVSYYDGAYIPSNRAKELEKEN